MSRYLGPKLKIIRRLGILPGFCREIKNNSFLKFKKDLSNYYYRLREKQKLKFNYGLTENQLFKYINKAKKLKGLTALILIQLLEMRLDSLCFILGFSVNINQARQLVNHGHITVNKKVVDIPSFQCKPNDIISVNKKEKSLNLINTNLIKSKRSEIPSNINFNELTLEAKILDFCIKKDSLLFFKESLVLEFYSH